MLKDTVLSLGMTGNGMRGPWWYLREKKGLFLLPGQSWACRNAAKQRKVLSLGLRVLQIISFSWYTFP